jgi:hypothetical protein
MQRMGKGLCQPSCRRGQGACLREPCRLGWLLAVEGAGGGWACTRGRGQPSLSTRTALPGFVLGCRRSRRRVSLHARSRAAWSDVGRGILGGGWRHECTDARCAPRQVYRRRQWQPRVRKGNTERSLATGSSRRIQDRDETALILWLVCWVHRRARVDELAAERPLCLPRWASGSCGGAGGEVAQQPTGNGERPLRLLSWWSETLRRCFLLRFGIWSETGCGQWYEQTLDSFFFPQFDLNQVLPDDSVWFKKYKQHWSYGSCGCAKR